MPTARRRVTIAELDELFDLVEGSDSIELKFTVPEEAHRSTATALGLDPLDAQIRQVYFFDTPDLALDRAGVVVRARRVQGRDHDTVVKLRPVEPSTVPDRLRALPECTVEVDVVPGAHVCSASLKGEVSPKAIRRAVNGEKSIKSLFSKAQRAFFAEHAPDGITLDDLSVLGPIFVLKVKTSPLDFSRKITAEVWLYPNGSRVLELSTKCKPGQGLAVAREGQKLLSGIGLAPGGSQTTKTKAALRYFSKQLQQAEAPS